MPTNSQRIDLGWFSSQHGRQLLIKVGDVVVLRWLIHATLVRHHIQLSLLLLLLLKLSISLLLSGG